MFGPIAPDQNDTNLTPGERVAVLTRNKALDVLSAIISSIVSRKDTREVPDLLHGFGLLANYEVYDADAAWDDTFTVSVPNEVIA